MDEKHLPLLAARTAHGTDECVGPSRMCKVCWCIVRAVQVETSILSETVDVAQRKESQAEEQNHRLVHIFADVHNLISMYVASSESMMTSDEQKAFEQALELMRAAIDGSR